MTTSQYQNVPKEPVFHLFGSCNELVLAIHLDVIM